MNGRICLLFKADKSNTSVRFLGESTARQSAFQFYLTFRDCNFVTLEFKLHRLQNLWISIQYLVHSGQCWIEVGRNYMCVLFHFILL